MKHDHPLRRRELDYAVRRRPGDALARFDRTHELQGRGADLRPLCGQSQRAQILGDEDFARLSLALEARELMSDLVEIAGEARSEG